MPRRRATLDAGIPLALQWDRAGDVLDETRTFELIRDRFAVPGTDPRTTSTEARLFNLIFYSAPRSANATTPAEVNDLQLQAIAAFLDELEARGQFRDFQLEVLPLLKRERPSILARYARACCPAAPRQDDAACIDLQLRCFDMAWELAVRQHLAPTLPPRWPTPARA